MRPVISVIMPVYNTAQFVYAAVDSILKQTFNDFEFIIIDDASTDNTRQILDEVSDCRIVRINNEAHTGNYSCRNQGLALAQGQYIAVMDGDDIALNDRLEVQFKFMETNPKYLAIGSNAEVFYENSKSYISQLLSDSDKIKVRLLGGNVFFHPTLFFRKEIFDLYNICYNKEYYYAADYDLMLNISRIGEVTNIPEPLVRYRVHQNQITSSKHQEQMIYADYIRLKQLDFFKLRPSTEETMIHLSLMKSYPVPNSKLIKAQKWCNKLLEKNHVLNLYNEEYLFAFFKERLKHSILTKKL